MIQWLVQSASAHPDLARGKVPAGLLSLKELDRFDQLPSEKRRRSWLLGRWTAKHLLQSAHAQRGHPALPLATFLIENDRDGVPYARLAATETPLDCSLSISHSHDLAFCALVEEPAWPVGADIERIEPRAPSFASDYFTEAEIEVVHEGPPGQRDTLLTAIWSAKEATLKALHLGLSVDTRRVSCLIDPYGNAASTWQPFSIECDRRLAVEKRLCGWWQLGQGANEGFVLTLVTAR